MEIVKEVLLTTCQNSQQWSVCSWDFNTGNAKQIYKNGGAAAEKSLKIIGNDFVLTADQSKPLLHLWPINSQEQQKNIKLVLPDSANALAVCPNNIYLALGIKASLYVWQLSSGKLLSMQKKHFQTITNIKFSSDGDYLLTTGADGMLVVYNFGNLINSHFQESEAGQVEPMYHKINHTAKITDVHVGSFGGKSRIATVAEDCVCYIYNLLDGQTLIKLAHDDTLSAVIFDSPCWNLFIGTNSGLIHLFNLKNPPRTVDISSEKNGAVFFKGHQKRINCMDLNITNEYLVSGSNDMKVIIWKIQSQNCIKVIEHKSVVYNVLFTTSHENIDKTNFKPKTTVKNLERTSEIDLSKCVISLNQFEDVCFDEEEQGSKIECYSNDVQMQIVKAHIVNKQLYDELISQINKNNTENNEVNLN